MFPSMEVAFANLSAIRRLNRASIVWIIFCKRRNLRGRSFNGSFHHEPSDALLTGGNGERAVEYVIILVGGQEIGGVNDLLLQLDLLSCFAGNVAPQVAEHGIFGAAFDKYGDDGGAACRGVHVDEVKFHVVLLAVDFVFAYMVKMELHQRQRCSVDGDATSRLVIDLDGVAIVDDFQRRKFVVKVDGSQLRRLRTDNVNGGLALAGFAGGEIRLEVAPMLRAFRSAITPMGSARRVFLGDHGTRENERGAKNETSCCCAGQASRHEKPPWQRRKNSISLCGRIFKYSVWKIRNGRVYSQGPSDGKSVNECSFFLSAPRNETPRRNGGI